MLLDQAVLVVGFIGLSGFILFLGPGLLVVGLGLVLVLV